MIKILRYLLIAMLPFVFAACDKDDDDDPKGDKDTEKSLLVGSWGYSNYDIYETLTFKKNGSYTWISVGGSGDWDEYGSYTLRGDILTLYDESYGDVSRFRIYTLTSRTLVIKSIDDDKSELWEWTKIR